MEAEASAAAAGASEDETSEAKQRRGICESIELGRRGRATLKFERIGDELANRADDGRRERRATVVKNRAGTDMMLES